MLFFIKKSILLKNCRLIQILFPPYSDIGCKLGKQINKLDSILSKLNTRREINSLNLGKNEKLRIIPMHQNIILILIQDTDPNPRY